MLQLIRMCKPYLILLLQRREFLNALYKQFTANIILMNFTGKNTGFKIWCEVGQGQKLLM